MSIATRRGDQGETDLLFGRRVAKIDIRVEAGGTLDELNAALGLARASEGIKAEITEAITSFQTDLVKLMGEVATDPSDIGRYGESGFRKVDTAMVESLDARVEAIEKDLGVKFEKWAIPGAAGDPCGAALDVSRTVCRRAERRVLALADADDESWNKELVRYLNRLSDVLWLLARIQERGAGDDSNA